MHPFLLAKGEIDLFLFNVAKTVKNIPGIFGREMRSFP